MDYPVRTISQLRPLLIGFRKANNLTQAQLALKLGIAQQTYAHLEANPDRASTTRVLHVLQVLGVDLVLVPREPASGHVSGPESW